MKCLIVVCRSFGTLYLFHLHRLDMKYYFILHIQPMKMEQIECSETSTYNNQTPGKYPEEYIQDYCSTVQRSVKYGATERLSFGQNVT